MLISHTKEFIFIKTSKAASTSIEVYFEPLCLPNDGRGIKNHRGVIISEEGIVGARSADADKTIKGLY